LSLLLAVVLRIVETGQDSTEPEGPERYLDMAAACKAAVAGLQAFVASNDPLVLAQQSGSGGMSYRSP